MRRTGSQTAPSTRAFWMSSSTAIPALLVVENCVSSTPWDADGDGANEIVVRTRWPEKPYTVYDMLDGEVQAVSWPDAVPEEVRENLMCIWEQ